MVSLVLWKMYAIENGPFRGMAEDFLSCASWNLFILHVCQSIGWFSLIDNSPFSGRKWFCSFFECITFWHRLAYDSVWLRNSGCEYGGVCICADLNRRHLSLWWVISMNIRNTSVLFIVKHVYILVLPRSSIRSAANAKRCLARILFTYALVLFYFICIE